MTIVEIFENKNSKDLIYLFNSDKNKFSNLLSSIFVKNGNVKLLKYLDDLNILNYFASKILFECLKSWQVKSTEYLNKFLTKDSDEAITFNRLIIHNSLLNQYNFNKRRKILPIIMKKISNDNFYQIIEQSGKGLENLKTEMCAIYLDLNLNKDYVHNIKKLKV